jgi:hypothetical protein
VNLAVSLGFLCIVCIAAYVWDRYMPARIVRHVAGSLDGAGPVVPGGGPRDGSVDEGVDDVDVGVMLVGDNQGVVLPVTGAPLPEVRLGNGDKQPLLG